MKTADSTFTDEQRRAVLIGRNFSVVVDRARRTSHEIKIVSVRKPARGKGESAVTTVSILRNELADLLLTSIDHTERTVREAVKVSADVLHAYAGEQHFSTVVKNLALTLLRTGWTPGLSAEVRAELEAQAEAAFFNALEWHRTLLRETV